VDDARATYQEGSRTRGREVALREGRARAIGTARLALAVLAVGLLVTGVWARLGSTVWLALGADLVAFVALVFVHARVLEAKERATAALRFHDRGLARLDHDWDHLPATSVRFASGEHPFTRDLDVFGHGSVMQLVDATETRFGEERLAKLLSLEDPGKWPDDVAARQRAVRDLAGRTAFREALATAGGVLADEKPDPAPLLAWAEEKTSLPTGLVVLGWVMPLGTLGFVLTTVAVHPPAGWITLVVLAALIVGIAVGVRLNRLLQVASAREQAATRWRAMIALIEREPFDAPLVRTDIASAEMIKLAANAFLATKISFINEIANVCEALGADVVEVARGMGLDARIGPKFLQAGLGYGGSCFTKDVSALKLLAGNSGYHFQLLNAVIEVNELQKRRVVSKLQRQLGELAGKRVALLGLAFKPNTDDMRGASSLVLAARLQAEGAHVRAFDPIAETQARELMPHLDYAPDALDAVSDADAVVLVTEWPEFIDLDWRKVAQAMRGTLVIDGRNALDAEAIQAAGLTYEGVGRGPQVRSSEPGRLAFPSQEPT